MLVMGLNTDCLKGVVKNFELWQPLTETSQDHLSSYYPSRRLHYSVCHINVA